jgi:hypothetical protein
MLLFRLFILALTLRAVLMMFLPPVQPMRRQSPVPAF